MTVVESIYIWVVLFVHKYVKNYQTEHDERTTFEDSIYIDNESKYQYRDDILGRNKEKEFGSYTS